MQIHQPSLSRMIASQMRGDALRTIFEHLAIAVAALGAPASQVTINWFHPDDLIEDGDLSPTITLSLQPIVRPEQATS